MENEESKSNLVHRGAENLSELSQEVVTLRRLREDQGKITLEFVII